VLFDLEPGWHIYWRNPGETGLPASLNIEATGYRIGPIAWPAPEVFEEADGLFTTYGYQDRVLLSVPLEAMANAPQAGLISAKPHVLVCSTECVPASFSLTSPVRANLPSAQQAWVDRLFAQTLARVPIAGEAAGIEASARWTSERPAADEKRRLALTIRPCAKAQAACNRVVPRNSTQPFIPLEDQAFEFSDVHVVAVPDAGPDGVPGTATIEMDTLRLEGDDGRLRGLVAIRDAQAQTQYFEIDLAIEAAATKRAALPRAESAGNWIEFVLFALLGGLILNAMPCVLPVLAIKIAAIAELSERDSRAMRKQGLAYLAGVLGSMGILAAIVISLRAAGHSVGWGFQFQQPLFVAGISAVLVAFALNLFGVFEIELGQGRLAQIGQDGSSTRRSVFEGLLAVVLATPCSAPFLGTAVGFAFAAASFDILTIFLAIGFGLALPFLAVSFVPSLARFIPRSGPWMLKLRAGLGFSLLATVVWLLWVVGKSSGIDAVIGMVAMLLLLAFLLWIFGQLRSAWLARACAVAIAGVSLVGFNLVDFESKLAGKQPAAAVSEEGWTAYSEEALAAVLAEGRPAFVLFTADWCITCLVNEQTVLGRSAVREAFALGGHALFKADWTRPDEKIRAKLAEFGRAGVPLYLVYSPDAPNRPQILSEILTTDRVTAALARSTLVGRR
jgi:thiol:disulfide interchange protein DsbD